MLGERPGAGREVLDAASLRGWCEAGRDALAAACAEIDGLNVFPVPDGDTGTNLLLTVEAVLAEVRTAPVDDLRAVAAAMAHGALTGARGNSGVLLSQLLRGLAEVLDDGPADGRGLARGLARGAELARAAVGRPVEGTLLTVAAAAARAAQAAQAAQRDERAGVETVAAASLAAARDALAGTPGQLDALRRAGVVDAGGRGWVVLLEALCGVLSGRAPVAVPPPLVRREPGGAAAVREAGSEDFAYEVQYLLRGASDEAVARLRSSLSALGDSVAVVGQAGLHNVHVHVDDVGAAVEAGLLAGRPYRISVTRFADQPPPVPAPPPQRVVVAVAAGAGLVRLLRGAGAVVVDAAAGRPDAEQLAAAVRATGAPEVVLLPGDPALAGVARAAAARLPEVRVEVVPTASVAQGLAALAVADPGRELAADVAAMTEAARATRTARVVPAVAAADTTAGPCLPGDLLGVLDGRVVAVGSEPEQVALRLLDPLLDGAELLSVVLGAGVPEAVGERLRAQALVRRPGVEVLVLDGGQPEPLLLAAE